MNDAINKLRKELSTKERTVGDLIRFLRTRSDDNPNYSLLLGAGCSVTSGISSASQLISEWKAEIYKTKYGTKPSDEEQLNSFLRSEDWYHERNQYSSLFEKKFDLPRQRRMFIEREVSDKNPSIGYAYLTKLIEKNFFKTIFTTNFDDLLNEAFYQFSNKRPIVCAHDSAINSITITSKRPKIIKLHGDYLFDDIKSSLRETESLEENIKNKFVEFAKDYGLIVIGYGGNDRSIIDILTYLLKNEDYFKHGIYWCLRSDCEINEDLRKMLWKDRVYFVPIDGFDELMAELNEQLNDGILPVNNILNIDNKESLIGILTSNEYLKNTKSEVIKRDINRLHKSIDKNIIDNIFKFIQDNKIKRDSPGFIVKGCYKELSDEEKKVLHLIQQFILINDYSKALNLINDELAKLRDITLFKIELLEFKANILEENNSEKNDELQNIYKELISLDENNIEYYINASNSTSECIAKIDFLDQIIKINPYNAKLYFIKASIIYAYYDDLISKDSFKYTLDDIIQILNKSILINPGVYNNAWTYKCDILKEKYSKEMPKAIEEIEKILEFYKGQNQYHPNYVKEYCNLIKLKSNDKKIIFDYIKDAIDATIKMDNSKYIKSNELLLLEFYSEYGEKKLLGDRLTYIENKYNVDNEFSYLKAKYYFEIFGKLSDSILILESISNMDNKARKKLIKYYLYAGEIEKAEKMKDKFYKNDYSIECDILERKGLFEASRLILKNELDKNKLDKYVILAYSYVLLKLELFDEAYSFTKGHLKYSNFTDAPLLINYFIAESKINKKVSIDKINEKIINFVASRNDIEMAAGYALIGDERNMFDYLKKSISKERGLKFDVVYWPVFEKYSDNSKFKEIIGLN